MQFDTLGPFEIKTSGMIKTNHVKELKQQLSDQGVDEQLKGPGCYVFCIKTSAMMPWYVGKSEKQSIFTEATNPAHLQIYNEILEEYKRGIPVFFFLPAMTDGWKVKTPTKGELPAVEFLENWLISVALSRNLNLLNISKTKMLKELYARGLFNAQQGDSNAASRELRKALGY